MSQRLWACVALALCASLNAHAQTTASPTTQSPAPGLTRAQVLEDLKQWHASGMTYIAHPSGYGDSRESMEYQRYLQRSSNPSVATKQPQPMSEPAQTASSQSPVPQP